MSVPPEHVHIDEDCRKLKGHFKKHVFHNCTFEDMNGLILEDCDMTRSKFTASKITDLQNFTATLNCLSFNRIEISDLMFDLLLCLLLKTKGNEEKRLKLIDVVGRDRALEILNQISKLEG